MAYFPDNYADAKTPSREYFMNVLNTIYPEYMNKIMLHADKQRYSATGEGQKTESIYISPAWQDRLESMPYLSCKYNLASKAVIFVCH